MLKGIAKFKCLRSGALLALTIIVHPILAGPPLTEVFPCFDFEMTGTNGVPIASCTGFGSCTFTGSGRIVVYASMSSNMTCPNQPVMNEADVQGIVGNTGLSGLAQGFCADNGHLRGRFRAWADCDGIDVVSGPFVFPENCFKGPLLIDPPIFPPNGPVYCENLQEQYECQEVAGFWSSEFCTCDYYSPILIDTRGNGFDLTDAIDGVDFDLRPDGAQERIGWTSPESDDAFLVLDRNGNGSIDNGAELFGNFTPQPTSSTPNGFLALAEFDKAANGGNGDEAIDSGDNIFSSLRLWRDVNHDGASQSGELQDLIHSGVLRMSLDYRLSNRRDPHGNRFRYRAKIYALDGRHLGRWAWDVFFVASQE